MITIDYYHSLHINLSTSNTVSTTEAARRELTLLDRPPVQRHWGGGVICTVKKAWKGIPSWLYLTICSQKNNMNY
jgi:hypothetical protein